MIRMSKWIVGAVLLAFVGSTAMAADAETLKTINDLKARIARLEEQQSMEQRREEIMKVVREMNMDAGQQGALPTWMEGLTYFGDLRLRYEHSSWSNALDDSTSRKNRGRARFRLRFGVKKEWLEKQLAVIFRLASGECGGATSTDQTFTDVFSQKNIRIDRAYAIYKPNWLKGLVIAAGKVANPLVCTDLTWDTDVNPEGAYVAYKRAFGPVEPFGAIGYFIVDEAHDGAGAGTDYDDTYVWVYQAGLNWTIVEDVVWTFAATLYDFDNPGQGGLETGGTGDGAAIAADELGRLEAINLTNKVTFKVMELPVGVYFDWVENCHNDATSTDYEDQNCGYALGVKVGQNKKAGDWSASYKFAHIQGNAWTGALNDSNFGGTNRRGHVFRGKYNITDFLTGRVSYFWTEPVTGASEDVRNCLWQFDLTWKF